jgi:hypothetical protein
VKRVAETAVPTGDAGAVFHRGKQTFGLFPADFSLGIDLYNQIHLAHVLLIGIRFEIGRHAYFKTFRLQPRHNHLAKTFRRVAFPTAVDEKRLGALFGGAKGTGGNQCEEKQQNNFAYAQQAIHCISSSVISRFFPITTFSLAI